tara:strand:- start:103 stop:858 length:756 start_codon:yes stop_codon:yes gene_type:complete
MISRTELIEEALLREAIRKIIKSKKYLKEAKAHASSPDAPYDITAMNFLRTLLQNILPKVEASYKSLTTSKEQRDSFRAHTLNGVDDLLTTVDAAPVEGEAIDVREGLDLEEEIEIDVGEPGTPEDEEGFIDITDEEPEEEPSEEEAFGVGISGDGLDNTGRNAAYTSFKDITTQIENAYAKIDADSVVASEKVPELARAGSIEEVELDEVTSGVPERKVFKAYLLKNLDLYFDRFEEELATNPESPEITV